MLVKKWILLFSRSVRYAYKSENFLKPNTQRSIPNENTILDIYSFDVVVVQRTAKKCTEIYNARAELLCFSLYLLLGDGLVPLAS